MRQANVKPQIRHRGVTQSVKRDQAKGTKGGVATANANHEKDATIRTQIDFTGGVGNKVEQRDQEALILIKRIESGGQTGIVAIH
jgi:hypothetical protein